MYEHLEWLIGTLGSHLPVHVVRAMRPDGTPAHIREDTEAIVRGETTRLANPPVFVKESVEYTPYTDPRHQAKFEAHLIRRGEIPRFVTVPLFARAFTGAKPAMLRRQCTGDFMWNRGGATLWRPTGQSGSPAYPSASWISQKKSCREWVRS